MAKLCRLPALSATARAVADPSLSSFARLGPMPEIDWPAKARELAADFATRAREHDREASFPYENFDALR